MRLYPSVSVPHVTISRYRTITLIPTIRPWRDEFSKFQGKSRMERWNGYIDEYIASGQDKRPRFEIERLSKIGAHGGPLYRQCEAESCERYEGRDVAAFKLCSGCKLVRVSLFYHKARLFIPHRPYIAVRSVKRRIGRPTRKSAESRIRGSSSCRSRRHMKGVYK